MATCAPAFPTASVRDWPSTTRLHLSTIVPAGEFVEGLREVARNNHHGRPAWFLGKIYPQGGILAYYPVAIALKWPTVLLVLLVAQHRDPRLAEQPRAGDLFLMSLFPLLFFLFALNARYNIGERHILPLYPFALLLAGGIWRSHPSPGDEETPACVNRRQRRSHPCALSECRRHTALRARLSFVLQRLCSPAE